MLRIIHDLRIQDSLTSDGRERWYQKISLKTLNTNLSFFLERIETHLVAIVLDASPGVKFASKAPQDGHNLMFRIFDAVVDFGNAHLLQSIHNKLLIVGCNSQET